MRSLSGRARHDARRKARSWARRTWLAPNVVARSPNARGPGEPPESDPEAVTAATDVQYEQGAKGGPSADNHGSSDHDLPKAQHVDHSGQVAES